MCRFVLTKRVTFVIRDPDINRVLGNQLDLLMDEKANMIDVIKKVDELILQRTSSFPVKGCRSLLHLTFHPVERRFYTHAALTAYSETERFLDVKTDPFSPLPDGAVVILALTICGGEWEQIVDVNDA